MANYGYIDLQAPTTLDALEGHVRKALKDWFRGRMDVCRPSWNDNGPTLFVFVPGSETHDPEEARQRFLSPGKPAGFPIALWGDNQQIAFRHGMNRFERWAQGVMEELLSTAYDRPIFYDATDQTVKPGTRRYRVGPKRTFYEYLTRGFVKPLTDDDRQYLLRYERQTPKGFWE